MQSVLLLGAVFELRIETDGAVCLRTVLSHLDTTWHHLSDFQGPYRYLKTLEIEN